RSQSLPERAADKVVRDRVSPNWFADGKRFWYEIKTGPDAKEWVLVDAEKGQRKAAFDHARLAAALAEAAGKSVTADNLPLTSVRVSGDLASMHFAALGKHWTCGLASFALHDNGDQEDQRTTVNVLDRPRPSKPDGGKSKIRFINRTTGKIKLVHVDQA